MPQRHKVLITGSSGMLGVDLRKELSQSYELYGIDKAEGPGANFQGYSECDITKKSEVIDCINKIHPDIVIHAAAMTDVDGCELDKDKAYRINSEGTGNVAVSCKESGAVLIYISTDFVFDGRKKTPYVEDDKTGPLSVYGDSKLKGEQAVMASLNEYFILRTSWLYGRYGKNFVDTIISKAETERVLKVVNDQVGSPTYTVDLAKAIHVLLDKFFTIHDSRYTIHGIYHVSNSGSTSWCEYAKEILRLAGSGTEVLPMSSEELNRPAKRPAMSVLDNSKFYKFTGRKLRHWKEALKEYINGE